MSTTEATETNAEYHADLTHIGNSMLRLSAQSLRLYYDIFVAQTTPKPPPTPAMILGSLTHTLTLEPDKLTEQFLCAEGCDSRRGKKWLQCQGAAAWRGVECVLPAQIDTATAMAAAVNLHPLASRLLSLSGAVEQSIRWEDTATGLMLKCKPDKRIDEEFDHAAYVELKSAIDPRPRIGDEPSPFEKQSWNFGYHCQSAHYLDGLEHETGSPYGTARCILIVVGSGPPHDVYVYLMDRDLVGKGRRTNKGRLERLTICRNTGVWQAPEQTELQTLKAPGWVKDYE